MKFKKPFQSTASRLCVLGLMCITCVLVGCGGDMSSEPAGGESAGGESAAPAAESGGSESAGSESK